MPKTGILVHGLNLHSDDWHERIFGNPPNLLGRASRAIQLLRDHYPETELMLFGSGASAINGRREGSYTIDYMLDHFSRLREFDAFEEMWRWQFQNLENKFRRIARPLQEPEVNNTINELRYGIPRFYGAGITRVVVVSDPPHFSRCAAHGAAVLDERDLFGHMSIVAEHSDRLHPRQRASDVVVFEPPTDGTNLLGGTAQRFFKIPADKREECIGKIDAVLKEYGA